MLCWITVRGTHAATISMASTRTSSRLAAQAKTTVQSPTKVKKEETPTRPRESVPRKRRTPKTEDESSQQPPKRPKREQSPDSKSPLGTPQKAKQQAAAAAAASKTSPKKTPTAAASGLKDRKLKAYAAFANASPFPDFPHPTPQECRLAHKILAAQHGERKRPTTALVAPSQRAGCGDSPSVLDALVRTILSQNTSDKNSTRAKLSMDKVYGRSDKWEAIVAGGRNKLQEAIKCGGLSVVKSKVILAILEQVHERYGKYSLDHLHDATSDDAMTEMLSFQGVGPKTASCVLLFCLRRESFAVDTHVHRITGLIGWRPAKATRDETHQHLDAKIPDEDKYGLHILFVGHGKVCEECKAGGKSSGKCELRKAFRASKLKGEAGEDVKQEEEGIVKKEEDQE
ncbi:base excision DNA repair protein [Coniella lustricola]|uniref:Base excision DNA repair protein n=1 Tax=Coniella lustricola TaxID=2025994 RepID=A0A2T3AB27_9PEZI|nr:base excision DNA repair protein [Coniella lustricola]